MLFLDKLAENTIKAAIDRGELDNLPGCGKPMILDDDSGVPPELRTGYRLLKNAGYLPQELQLRTEVKKVEELLLLADCDCEKTKLTVKLSLLKSKLSARR